jgi:hypothetical protein
VLLEQTLTEIPANSPPGTNAERLDACRDGIVILSEQRGVKCRLVHEEPIMQDGVPGRDMQFLLGDKYIQLAKFFISEKRLYLIHAVTRQGTEKDEATRRFLSSFRFEKLKM